MPGRHTRTTAQRGYDFQHQQERARWHARVEAGLVDCHAERCIERIRWIAPGTPWDLGHTDDRTDWTGPEHARCNRSAGGRNGAKVANAGRGQGKHTSREW